MRRFYWLLIPVLLLAGAFRLHAATPSAPTSSAPMTTRSSVAPGAGLTVLHVGAAWCPPCVAMEPAVHEFEAAWKDRVNFVNINADQHTTAEYSKYRHVLANVEAIPYTAWLDADGKVLREKVGYADAAELDQLTRAYVK